MAHDKQIILSQKALALKQSSQQSRLIDEHEAAYRLGLKVATLRRWRWAGKPPRFLKIGSAVRYDPAELAAFVEASRRTSTTGSGEGAGGSR